MSRVRVPAFLQNLVPPDRAALARAAVEIALVLLLAWQAAGLAWLLAVPPGPVGDWSATGDSPTAPVPALALPFDPFHPGAHAGPATASASGFRLFGVRAAGDGGSAILADGDGAQAAFLVGDEVAPGVTLAAVAAGHAVLRTGSGDQRLELDAGAVILPSRSPHVPGALPAAGAAVPASQAPAAVDPGELLAQAGLRARTEGGRVTGYTLIPRGGGQLLRQAGLQAGDVLVAVDGNRLNPERLADLESELASRDEVRLTIERDGQARTLTLRTRSP